MNVARKYRCMLLVPAALGILLTGCGYSAKRPFSADIDTVYVEMLHSREFRRELEFHLTEALVKRIEMDTPYRIADRKDADTVFSGEILEVRQSVQGNLFQTDDPRQIGTSVVMRYRWQDQRTGDILVERSRFVQMDSYIPAVGESFTSGVAIRSLDRMAERIVETMETGW
ncbi:MAG: hypothetical protein GXP29_07035 [Planctomycetes bacterium]|nr:hypothetical protein [Planctomycetota bacterium]